MTAKRCPGSSLIWLAMTGNFCKVLTMIVLPSSSACVSWLRGLVDILHHAPRLFELAHRALQLPVEHAPVGDDDDRVEDALGPGASCSVGSWWASQAMVIALAAARAVLDQVALARPLAAGIGHQAPHGVELVVARKDDEAFARLFTHLRPLLPPRG